MFRRALVSSFVLLRAVTKSRPEEYSVEDQTNFDFLGYIQRSWWSSESLPSETVNAPWEEEEEETEEYEEGKEEEAQGWYEEGKEEEDQGWYEEGEQQQKEPSKEIYPDRPGGEQDYSVEHGSDFDFPGFMHLSARRLSPAVVAARPVDFGTEPLQEESLDDPTAAEKQIERFAMDQELMDDTLPGLWKQVHRLVKKFDDNPIVVGPWAKEYITTGPAHRERKTVPLTSKQDLYNFFYLDDPAVGNLFWFLKKAFHRYAEKYELDLNQSWWIHGWANCFRQGDGVRLHSHNSRISGNFAAHVAPNSYTAYSDYAQEWKVFDALYANPEASHEEVMATHRLDLRHMSETGKPEAKSEPGRQPFKDDFSTGTATFFNGFTLHESNRQNSEDTEWYKTQAEETGAPDCRVSISFDIWPETFVWHDPGAGPMMNKHSVPIHVPGDADFHPGIGAQAKAGDAMGGAIKNALRLSGVPPLYDGLGVTSISDEGEWQDHVQLIHQMALGRDVWPKFHMLWQKALFEGEEGEGGEGEEEEWVDEEEEGKDEEGGAGGEQPEKCNAAREACDGEDEEEEEDEQEEMR